MNEHSRTALVAAIGGTYFSLAIADIDELTISNFALLSSADFDKPTDAIQRYLSSVPRCPDKVGVAVTGQVSGDVARMEVRPWTFSARDIMAATGAEHVHMISDLEALALMLPHLSGYDAVTVKDGMPALHGTRLAVNAGTTLGVAALVKGAAGAVPVVGRAGRAGFRLDLPGEFDPAAGGHSLLLDQVLTGRGLVSLYHRLAERRGVAPTASGARAIVEQGLTREDETAIEALELMAGWLGRYAADMALTFDATGGIYLSGGLAANLLPLINGRHFLDELEAGIGDQLGEVSVRVVKTGADTGLRGAALALANWLPARPSLRRATLAG